jgi:acetyl-CoA carboxylase carboxyltransferase component
MRHADLDLTGLHDGHVVAQPDSPTPGPALRPLQRLELLCDEGSLHLIRSEAMSEAMGDKAQPGDGVVGAAGRIGDRPVFCYAQDSRFAGGSVGSAHADTIARVQRLALEARVPVIGFVESGGARMQEGLGALNGYARIFSQHVAAAGEIPQLSVITGTSAGGGSYSPALTDFTIMTEQASMFLTGPAVVREVTGEAVTARDLGGPDVHRRNGVSHFVVDNDVDSIFLLRQLLGYLPQSTAEAPPSAPSADPDAPDPGGQVPLDPRRPYDMREVARGMKHLGGVIDASASEKGAEFVGTCNRFGLPLVVLVDTPGFLPGSGQEALGVIRHGAKLLHAFAAATVPRFTVVLRKAYGGAYITMNSRDLGASLVLAWSRAELGIMGPEQAVGIVHRRELTAAADPGAAKRRLADDYAARHLSARAAAAAGHIDEVILPAETRGRLAWALGTMRRPRRG